MGKIELDHTGAGSGITLSSDGTDLLLNGTAIGGGGGASALTIDTKTGAYTVVSGDLGKIIEFTGTGAVTASLTSASTLGAGWYAYIRSNKTTGSATIDPDGSETIEGATTLSVKRGQTVKIVSDGTNWLVTESDFPRGFSYDNANNAAAANASGSGAVAIGYGATASGGYNFAAGASSAGAGASAGTGGGAVSLGGSYASGTDSFAAANLLNTSSYGATGTGSIAIGRLCQSTGTDSVAIGPAGLSSGLESIVLGDGTASGNWSIAIGDGTTASNSAAVAIGQGCQADALRSFALGFRTDVNGITGKYAWSGASISGSNDGSSQEGRMVLTIATTDATPTTLTTFLTTPSATNQIILPNNSAYAFHGTIVARQQASAGTACAAWKIEGLIRREGSAGTTVLVNSATTVLDNTPAWGMALSADTTNGGLKIEVTGAAATNIRWVATVHTSEVTY